MKIKAATLYKLKIEMRTVRCVECSLFSGDTNDPWYFIRDFISSY